MTIFHYKRNYNKLGLEDTAVSKIDIYSFENESGFTSGKEKRSYINYKKRSNEKLLIYCHIWPWKQFKKVCKKSKSLFIYSMKTNSSSLLKFQHLVWIFFLYNVLELPVWHLKDKSSNNNNYNKMY